MAIFPKKSKPPEASKDPWWAEVDALAAELRRDWGLGADRDDVGYRGRLRRLCEFLRRLGEETAPAGQVQFARYELVLSPSFRWTGAREAYVQRLDDLRTALAPLGKVAGQTAETCLVALRSWSPTQSLASLAGESPADHTAREINLGKTLEALQELPVAPGKPKKVLTECLKALGERLASPPAAAAPGAEAEKLKDARTSWSDFVEDCFGDWEWAYLQVLVRLAQECLREKPVSAKFCALAAQAGESLAAAIPSLEKRGLFQYRTQGLYGVLAATYLVRAKDSATPPENRLELIERAVTYARHAVEMEPESVRERLVLLEVLSTVEDTEELKTQAEIALHLDAGAGTLRAIGASFWSRVVALQGRAERLRLLKEAVRFFTQALREVENASFNSDAPLDQIQAHGWGHFWLGRFQVERGRYLAAITHLKTARELGFKPIESRVELAWACWLLRDRKNADRAFQEATAEASRQSAPRKDNLPPPPIAQEPGEERKIVDLQFDAYTGWAFLCAEWDPGRALDYAGKAETLLPAMGGQNPKDLEAALDEVRGRILLRQGDLDGGIQKLEESVTKSPRGGAYCALGCARLDQREQSLASDAKAAGEALRKAQEAYRLARKADPQRRYRREIRELRRRLRSASPAEGAVAGAPDAAGGSTGGAVAGQAQAPPSPMGQTAPNQSLY